MQNNIRHFLLWKSNSHPALYVQDISSQAEKTSLHGTLNQSNRE